MLQTIKSISITEIEGFSIGQAELMESGTGVTVILTGEKGAACGVDIRGGGPASRECGLLNPLAANDAVHAVVLSGGSAFGLDSASGVMKYLEEKNIGFPTSCGVVPIVCASCIYDLEFVSNKIRPDATLGYQACLNAPNFQEGNYGAGCGATCGKAMGEKFMMKAGIGQAAIQLGNFKIGAVVVVNAMGDIFDPHTGKKIAGMLNPQGNLETSTLDVLCSMPSPSEKENTTIGAIFTNARFNKTELTKIAGMAHDGFARAINPVHTMFDGDSIYALSSGDIQIDINIAGSLAAEVMAQAIVNAVKHTTASHGVPCASDIH